MDYKVQFDVFEGPMDLLLYLVRKQEVDIYQVNLTQLATEFIQYVEFMMNKMSANPRFLELAQS